MLDRIGDEVARATSIVRYAPGSHFSAHTHTGGEEFLVLEGTFQDEYGDYPTGTYVRNPIGTSHTPKSESGCTIFVKLWQFSSSDPEQFAVDLNNAKLSPKAGQPGIEQVVLHHHESESVWLESWQAGATRNLHHEGGAEILVLDGSLNWRGAVYSGQDWLRFPPGVSELCIAGETGTRLWLKTGHLSQIVSEGWKFPDND